MTNIELLETVARGNWSRMKLKEMFAHDRACISQPNQNIISESISLELVKQARAK